MDRGLVMERDCAAQEGRVFDVQASIRLMRQDIERYGQVSAETRQQAYDEELTFVAEGINAPLETTFTLHQTEHGLVNTMGSTLRQTLEFGREAAERKAGRTGRDYNVRRAVHNYHEGEVLEAMMQGNGMNTVVSFSPFPQEALGEYGKSAVEDDGYQPDRLLGFIYVFTKKSDTELEVTSMSVDNCDLEAFRAVAARQGIIIPADVTSDDFLGYRYQARLDAHQQAQLPGQLVATYDNAMQQLYGEVFRAGRMAKNEPEAWAFIHSQPDLVDHYMRKLEQLAHEDPINIEAKKRLTYGFWAALKDRIKAGAAPVTVSRMTEPGSYAVCSTQLEFEMQRAYAGAAARQERLVGCGGALAGAVAEGTGDLLGLSPEDARTSIFGDKSPENKSSWKWKKGTCVVKKCPTRPGETKVGPCSICTKCQHAFDNGRDPTK